MSMTRWKITIEYNGGAFSGWQRQEHVPSVQQCIEEAITGFCQQDITIHAAGRTDAGVHAYGQVAHFDLDYGDRPLSGFELLKALNAHLRPHKISIVDAAPVDSEFHARFSALNKLYIYRILNRAAPPALEEGLVWHAKRELDAQKMHEAAQHLIGYHDFTTFRDSQCQAKSPMRTLDRIAIRREGDMIILETEARSFLHHQVRNMVGTLALIGEGKWTRDDLEEAFAAKDRTRGGPTAPADGLYLARIDYERELQIS